MSARDISLGLTPGQVAQVVDAAASAGEQQLLLLSGVECPRELAISSLIEDPKISKSLLLGLAVLVSFPPDGGGRANKDVAQELGLAASTSHRYIRTLVAAGLLEQDHDTRWYRRTQLSGRGPVAARAATASAGSVTVRP
jgi:DNA-binding MarR family transcriptional regulator